MTEKEKMHAGMLYDANNDPELIAERLRTADLCYDYNLLRPSQRAEADALLRRLLGRVGQRAMVMQPFRCDYGSNVEMGDDSFINYNCTILDEAKVRFGNHVFVGPDCGFYTACHPFDAERRNAGLEYARPITVGDNVWIGGGVRVMPGVRIGEGSIIGGGSVVTRDIPAGVVAVGNPCRVLRAINQEDKSEP